MNLDPTDRHWTAQAVCATVDPEIFYPDPGGDTRPARTICATCPVRLPCLKEGLGDEHGVFGGLNYRDRRHLRQVLRKHPALREALLDTAAQTMRVPEFGPK